MAKIAEIKARVGRKAPRDIFVAPDHALLEEIHREERAKGALEERKGKRILEAAEKHRRDRIRNNILLWQRLKTARAREIAVERKHKRSSAIQALLDSGMSRQQIAESLGLSYGAVAKTLWRWGRNACQKS
jgi:DNA-binding NarL/FixJ family response regulator